MALTLGDNFSYQGAKPLDARLKYDTLAAMKTVADSTMYDGCLAYCVATDKTYQWKSTNTVDPDTGKWSEYSSGGHEIKNNGVPVTERGVMNFTDFDIADDSTNEETDVKAHRLTSAEIADICTPLPGAVSDMPVLFDETGAEYVVGWYKLANGTKKPVYKKLIVETTPSTETDGTIGSKFVDVDSNLDSICSLSGIVETTPTSKEIMAAITYLSDSQAYHIGAYYVNMESFGGKKLKIVNNKVSFSNKPILITIEYTKTTDTPV